jgi:HemY protein
MFRLFTFLFIACLGTVAAVWVAEQSGDMRLFWEGYLIETSVSVFIGAIICITTFGALAFQLLRTIVAGPKALLKGRKQRAEARGYKALMRGMVAVAAGDVAAAKKESQRVQSLSVARPLRLLLAAQCAQLAGDGLTADESFRAMLSEPESEFLGLRGLLVQALRNGEIEAALGLARRAYEIRPQAEWVLKNLIELETIAGNWPDAERSVITAERLKIIDSRSAQRRRALILFQRAQLAHDENNKVHARNFALRAVRLRPEFVPAVKLAAELLVSGKRPKKAKSLLKRAWEAEAHPDFAELYVNISKPRTLVERLKILDGLVSSRSNHPEALLLMADAALDASLWGTARESLGKAMEGEPDQRLYRLMARLEQSEHGNEGGARQWLLKATKAKEPPQWNCQVCGTSSLEWVLQCSSCESIDSLEWNLDGQENQAESRHVRMVDEIRMGSM